MKIAIVRQRYNPYGGAERFVSRAMAALRDRGAEVALITRQWKEPGEFRAVSCDPFYLGSLWRDWGFARCVCRTVKKLGFDLVQSHERIPCCDVYRAGDGVHREWLKQRARQLGWIGKASLQLNPYHHYVKAMEARLFASPGLKAVICNSEMVKQEVRDYFRLPETMLHTVYSGVDTEAYHPRLRRHRGEMRARHGVPESAPLFLFVGSGFERKGLAGLLRAMRRLPDHYLAVVGTDKRLKRFEREAMSLGLTGRVRFLGGQQDVKPFYGMADALVLPTLYDPFPNVALEAMAAGLPVVTSLKSGAAELIQNGVNGYVCDALDVDGLVAAMKNVVAEERREMLGNGARQAVGGLTLETMAARMVQVYESVLASK